MITNVFVCFVFCVSRPVFLCFVFRVLCFVFVFRVCVSCLCFAFEFCVSCFVFRVLSVFRVFVRLCFGFRVLFWYLVFDCVLDVVFLLFTRFINCLLRMFSYKCILVVPLLIIYHLEAHPRLEVLQGPFPLSPFPSPCFLNRTGASSSSPSPRLHGLLR